MRKLKAYFYASLFVVIVIGTVVGYYYYTTIYPLALAVYHESRGEEVFGQQMVAYVVVKRAEANRRDWGGDTIRGVVYADNPCQFSFTCENTGRPHGNPWAKAKRIALQVWLGFFSPPEPLARARYYMNPEDASQRNKCWFTKKLARVGIVGQHYFYAEPVLDERYPVEFGCVPLPRPRPTLPEAAPS